MLKRSGINRTLQRGFSLIEVLIAVAVLSFGLLAIGSFQAKLLNESGYSKARAEALALAQERIDEMRNYATEHDLVGNLVNNPKTAATPADEYTYPTDVPAGETTYTTIPEDTTVPDTIDGINATFTRKLVVDNAGEISNAYVIVSWLDRAGEEQQVKLETELAWRNPRGTSDVGTIEKPLVDSPTGKAYLGDGHVDSMDDLLNKDGTTDNNDGTYSTYNEKGDLQLVVPDGEGGGDVVLTLPKACKVDAGCTDFVKITGTVFFDAATTGLNASNVYVLASDAAYCARWKPTGVSGNQLTTSTDMGTSLSDIPGTDGYVFRNNDADFDFKGNADTTSDYNYFNYTCYIGGGWYGNIGLAMTGNNVNRQDFACVGDPENSTNLRWKRVELAKRRVYRGMLHKYTIAGDGTHDPIKDDNDDIIYYTRGIRDAAVMPDSGWPERNQGHDFIISRATSATVDDCVTAMTRPDTRYDADDTTANLFSKVPGDFICLNADNNNYAGTGDMAAFDGYDWLYLNTFDTSMYDAKLDCPYDPSDPPSTRYAITGSVQFNGTAPASADLWGSSDPLDGVHDGTVNTSDGFDNCRVTSLSGSVLNFECDYYVWSHYDNQSVLVETPWVGNVAITSPVDTVCAPTYDTTVYDYKAVYDFSTGITGSQTASFVCESLENYTIAGSITVDAGNDLTTGTLTVSADNETDNIGCSTTVVSAETVNYSCNVLELAKNQGYTGTVTITLPDGIVCDGQASDTGVICDGSVATIGFTDLTTDATRNVVTEGPMEELTFSGTVINGVDATSLFGLELSTSNGATCSPQIVSADDTGDVTYNCSVVIDSTQVSMWEGTVTVTPPTGYWCGTASAAGTSTGTISADGETMPDVTCVSATATYPVYIKLTLKNGIESLNDKIAKWYISTINVEPVTTETLTCDTYNVLNLTDVEMNCTTSEVPISDTWKAAVIVVPNSGYVSCPAKLDYTGTGLTANQTYYETVTIVEGTACP